MPPTFIEEIRANLKPALKGLERDAPYTIENFKNLCQVDNTISIGFSLEEDSRVNAYAKGSNSYFEICVFTGVLEQVFLKISKLIIKPEIAKILELPSSIKTSETRTEPIDITAKVVYFAWDYILLHEFSHIVLGHLDWLKANHNLTCLFEQGKGSVTDPKVYHALEFQADAYALLLGVIQYSHEDQYYSGIAAVIVQNLLADGTPYSRSAGFTSHPHSSVRLMQLLTFVTKSVIDDPTYYPLRNWLLGAMAITDALYLTGEEIAVRPTLNNLDEFFSKVPLEIHDTIRCGIDLAKQMKPLHRIPTEYLEYGQNG
jgi:hypothetical protein